MFFTRPAITTTVVSNLLRNSSLIKRVNRHTTRHLESGKITLFKQVNMPKETWLQILQESTDKSWKNRDSYRSTTCWNDTTYERYQRQDRSATTKTVIELELQDRSRYTEAKIRSIKSDLRLPLMVSVLPLTIEGSLLSLPKKRSTLRRKLIASHLRLDILTLNLISNLTYLILGAKVCLIWGITSPAWTFFLGSLLLVPLAYHILSPIKALNKLLYCYATGCSKETFSLDIPSLLAPFNHVHFLPWLILRETIRTNNFNLSGLRSLWSSYSQQSELRLSELKSLASDWSESNELDKWGWHRLWYIESCHCTKSKTLCWTSRLSFWLQEHVNYQPELDRWCQSLSRWIERCLDRFIRENLTFHFDSCTGIVTCQTTLYLPREGIQYLNVKEESHLARAAMSVMSRNESSCLSLSLPEYRTKQQEYFYHGSTAEATMRQIEQRRVSWLIPSIFFNRPNLFGMESSTRVLSLKGNGRLPKTPWEQVWDDLRDDLVPEDRLQSSSYPRDVQRMFMVMNYETGWVLTIPNDRCLKDVASVAHEILSDPSLSELHHYVMPLRDQMKFLDCYDESSFLRNRTKLLSGLPVIKAEQLDPFILEDKNLWTRLREEMIPNLSVRATSDVAAPGQPNLILNSCSDRWAYRSLYPRFDSASLDLQHILVEFSLVTSLIASRDVQRHRTGVGWNHKVLFDNSPLMHPLYAHEKALKLMKDCPVSVDKNRLNLTDLTRLPSGSLMRVGNVMSLDKVIFLLNTRIQSNLEYGLLFAAFYLKLLDAIEEAEGLNDLEKLYVKSILLRNVQSCEVCSSLKKLGVPHDVIKEWLRVNESHQLISGVPLFKGL